MIRMVPLLAMLSLSILPECRSKDLVLMRNQTFQLWCGPVKDYDKVAKEECQKIDPDRPFCLRVAAHRNDCRNFLTTHYTWVRNCGENEDCVALPRDEPEGGLALLNDHGCKFYPATDNHPNVVSCP